MIVVSDTTPLMLNQSIRQTPIFPKDIDIKLKIWYNLCRFLNKGYSNVQEII